MSIAPILSLDLDRRDNEQGKQLLNFLLKIHEKPPDSCVPAPLIEHVFAAAGCDTTDSDAIALAGEAVQVLLEDCAKHLHDAMLSARNEEQILTTATTANVLVQRKAHWFSIPSVEPRDHPLV